jgi:hypothetical protein
VGLWRFGVILRAWDEAGSPTSVASLGLYSYSITPSKTSLVPYPLSTRTFNLIQVFEHKLSNGILVHSRVLYVSCAREMWVDAGLGKPSAVKAHFRRSSSPRMSMAM